MMSKNNPIITRAKPFLPILGLFGLLGAMAGGVTTNVYQQRKANKKLNRIEKRVQQLAALAQLQEENQAPAILEMQKKFAEIQDQYRQALAVHGDKDKLLKELDEKLKLASDFMMKNAQLVQVWMNYTEKLRKLLKDNNIDPPEIGDRE